MLFWDSVHRLGFGDLFAWVIVEDGKIIGEAFNRVVADRDPTDHGEVMAIKDT